MIDHAYFCVRLLFGGTICFDSVVEKQCSRLLQDIQFLPTRWCVQLENSKGFLTSMNEMQKQNYLKCMCCFTTDNYNYHIENIVFGNLAFTFLLNMICSMENI